jgi:hypothetical protein
MYDVMFGMVFACWLRHWQLCRVLHADIQPYNILVNVSINAVVVACYVAYVKCVVLVDAVCRGCSGWVVHAGFIQDNVSVDVNN